MQARFDTIDAWLGWLETLHPRAIDMGLDRVRAVASRLGVLSPGVPVVTVTGTNGKGSTVAFLEALLRAQGLRMACYTSPHILRFNERIRIDGAEVDDAALVAALARVDAARGDLSLTYFEFTTLAAFLLFTDACPDAWVLEVGLGGRLDAVNLIDADIAVITSVGLDHREWLGDTRESVGTEKAGIFRPGRPAIVGDFDPPATVCHAVGTLGARGLYAGRDFLAVPSADGGWRWEGAGRDGGRQAFDGLPVTQLPPENAALALQVLACLPFPINPAALPQALAGTSLAGRNQCIALRGGQLVVDVGHNADAFRFLRRELVRTGRGNRFHVVLGMLADKDIAAAVRELEELAVSWHIAPLPSPRSASNAQLRRAIGSRVTEHASVDAALHAAVGASGLLPVLATGSFYTVAAALQWARGETAGKA